VKKIEATEKMLLETHFAELNSDRERLAHDVTALARFVPFIRGPVTVLVDRVEKINHENMSAIEKCSKVALSVLSFIPRLVFKACHVMTSLFHKCIRYPKGYCHTCVQNPDRLDGDIVSLYHRISSFRYSISARPLRYRSVEELEQEERESVVDKREGKCSVFLERNLLPYKPKGYLEEIVYLASKEMKKSSLETECLRSRNEITSLRDLSLWHRISASAESHLSCHTAQDDMICDSPFPLQYMKKTDGERCVENLEKRIGNSVVSYGTFYSGIRAVGYGSNRLINIFGNGIAFPCMRAGKKGRCDLKVLTALSLKGAELFLATDKGAALSATFLEKVIPIQLVEAFLQQRVEALVLVPRKILAYLGNFQEQLNAVRRLPSAKVELKQAAEHTSEEFNLLISQWEDYCVNMNSIKDMCSPSMQQLLNRTRASLDIFRKGVVHPSSFIPKLSSFEVEKKYARSA